MVRRKRGLHRLGAKSSRIWSEFGWYGNCWSVAECHRRETKMPTRRTPVKVAASRQRLLLPTILALSGLFLFLNAWLISQEYAGL